MGKLAQLASLSRLRWWLYYFLRRWAAVWHSHTALNELRFHMMDSYTVQKLNRWSSALYSRHQIVPTIPMQLIRRYLKLYQQYFVFKIPYLVEELLGLKVWGTVHPLNRLDRQHRIPRKPPQKWNGEVHVSPPPPLYKTVFAGGAILFYARVLPKADYPRGVSEFFPMPPWLPWRMSQLCSHLQIRLDLASIQ